MNNALLYLALLILTTRLLVRVSIVELTNIFLSVVLYKLILIDHIKHIHEIFTLQILVTSLAYSLNCRICIPYLNYIKAILVTPLILLIILSLKDQTIKILATIYTILTITSAVLFRDLPRTNILSDCKYSIVMSLIMTIPIIAHVIKIMDCSDVLYISALAMSVTRPITFYQAIILPPLLAYYTRNLALFSLSILSLHISTLDKLKLALRDEDEISLHYVLKIHLYLLDKLCRTSRRVIYVGLLGLSIKTVCVKISLYRSFTDAVRIASKIMLASSLRAKIFVPVISLRYLVSTNNVLEVIVCVLGRPIKGKLKRSCINELRKFFETIRRVRCYGLKIADLSIRNIVLIRESNFKRSPRICDYECIIL